MTKRTDENGPSKVRRAKASRQKTAPKIGDAKSGGPQTAADKARQREMSWQSLVETSAAWIWETDAGLRHIYTNAFVTKCLGYLPAEFLKLDTLDLIHPDDRELAAELVQNAAAGKGGWTDKVLRWRHNDGSWRYIESSGSAVFDEDGAFKGLRGIDRDVTDRKRTEEALRESEAAYRALAENVPDIVYRVHLQEGRMRFFNDRITEITGYEKDELEQGSVCSMESRIVEEDRQRVIDTVKQAIGARSAFEVEYRFRHKNGAILTLLERGAVVPDGAGAPLSIDGVIRDITMRKRAEEALRESEEKFSKIFKQAPLLVTLTELDEGRFLDVNERFLQISGFVRDEVINRTAVDIGWISPGQRTLLHQALREQGRVADIELSLRRKDGRPVVCLYSGEMITVKGKQCLLSIARDITEHKNAEMRIKESERKYRNLFESATDGVFIADLGGNIIDANMVAYQRLGYTKEELLALSVSKLDSPEFASRVPERFRQIREQGVAMFESGHKRKDGSVMPVEVNARMLDFEGRLVILSLVRDITERKRAEEEISERGAMLQQIMDTASVAIGLVDKTGRITHANRRMAKMFGRPLQELVGCEYVELVHPSEREAGRKKMLSLLASEIPSVDLERRYWRKDGTEFWGHLACRRFQDVHGRELGLIGVISDISERKRAEEKLRESENRLNTILDNVGAAIFIKDMQYRYTYVNRKACEIFGRTREEIVGKGDDAFFSAASVEEVMRSDRPVIERGETVAREAAAITLSDGVPRTYWTVKLPLRDGAGRVSGLCGIATDISDRKRAEEALRASEERFRAITMTASDAILLMDDTGMIVYWNPAAERIFGYSTGEAVGKDLHALLAPQRLHGEYHQGFVRFVMNGQGPVINRSVEMVAMNKEETEFPIEVSTSAMNINGKWHALGIVRDITERKRAEEELREKENRYRTLFEAANDGIFIQDGTGFRDCNRRGAEMYGLTRAEIIGRSPGEFAPERQPDGRLSAEVAAEKTQAALNGVPQVFDWQPLRADGAPFDVEVTLSRLELGGELYLQAIVRDITERKRAENALRASEERFRAITVTASDAILLMDDTGMIVYWNPAAERIFGYSADEIAGKDLHVFLAPQRLHGEYHKGFARFVMTGQGPVINRSVEMVAMNKEGTEFPIEVSTSAMNINGKWHALGIVRDITERKRAEEKISKYSWDLQRLLAVSREMTATTDVSGLYRAAVQTAVDLLGFDYSTVMVLSEDKAGLTITDAIGFPSSMIGHYSLLEGEGLSTYVVKSKRPDAVLDFRTETRFEVPPVARELNIRSALCVPMMLGEDVVGVLIGHSLAQREFSREEIAIYENIGNEAAIAIKNAISLNALRKSEGKLRNITSNIAEGLYVLDAEGRITFMNEEAERLLGWSREEMNERGAHELVHFRKADGAPLPLEDCRMHGIIVKRTRFASNDEVFVRKDGTVFPISVVCSPVVDDSGAVASVVAFRDITETKRLEQELLKIQKLESVGTLAGGIAHDFNNLLQGVFGYISMAKLSLGEKERAGALLEQAEKALHQSVNLTTQLLTFSKGGKPVKKRITLGPVIENGVRFALSGSQLTYRIDLAQELRPVEADEGQLGQVIHNIVLNADQAMPLGGRIEIEARNVPASSPELPPGLASADHVRISIQDHGAGIPAEYLPRIFDPYFTTKEKGSGLGLATSYAIVRNHGGMITVSSELGKGSTFNIFLPASTHAPGTPSRGGTSAQMRPVRVLVMDDEEVVRNVAVELLRELGHDVECVEHGAAALDAYRRAKDAGRPFAIVILDLTIRGGMGGMETLRNLREFDPQVKAVVSSGYSDDEIVADFRQRGFSAFLKKPYGMSALRDTLQGLMV